ncbi:hypothetical protein H5410_016755 [Solanum commersonii]|uniref:Uncharacterized protein n=1 Tax=Solanum commersonii TaxID=4109 RepID=A0A9J5ZXY4_SOLCO|nr:hypothetical protein H5410_016755 [Solanum commersonii]
MNSHVFGKKSIVVERDLWRCGGWIQRDILGGIRGRFVEKGYYLGVSIQEYKMVINNINLTSGIQIFVMDLEK